ncbi:glycosyltransferase family 39 protein [Endozoicomonas sp. SM1973]|uniref:Glycosyltransferase family 39 protein n=1 Tax=Spartinivicinus marinus TaxID=2994442 RepID=A0A853I0Q8_9GAMM|nr:glycosyltransferase family 39 protein [Spartinivicinus marinus]MCX4028125.1 glycosyltransferase family 39 protein [Spartinivicinus marinus]NYZ66199.1 glycosyltransferase family 39 protein [Spartinivicinus marinus]
MKFRQYQSTIFCILLCFIVAFLFLTGAPAGGAFSWPDSPRHALNGAFVMDFIGAAPFYDPVTYAYDYYSQYPALTILFYPPLFSFLLAPFYAIFGVSQETALFVLFICYVFFACGCYFLARQWLTAPLSFGVALMIIASPEIAYWGRQIMLEIPAFAFLVWSSYFLVRYTREQRISYLYLSIALLVLGIYTKLSIAFVCLPYLIALISARGYSLIRDKHSYIIAGLAIIGILPLVYLTIEFGQTNVQSAMGISDAIVSRLSIDGWIWYALQFPAQVGWPVLLISTVFLILWLSPFTTQPNIHNSLFLISWLIVGYLFYSSIDLKETRHSIYLLLPIALFAGFSCHYLFQNKLVQRGLFQNRAFQNRALQNRALQNKLFKNKELWAATSCILIGVLTLTITTISRPVHYVDGYSDVVDYIAEVTPDNSNVLFSGYRDGSFIFNMRAKSNRPDINILRADKLLLEVAVRRSLGVKQQSYSEVEINDLINKMGVHYIVAQPNFWVDLDQMAKLQNVLRSDKFKEVKRFKMPSNYNAQEKELIVYRNLGNIADGPIKISNNLPIIGRKITNSPKTGG